MKHELIFEIGSEEIPAGYIQPALNFLSSSLTKRLSELNLPHGELTTAATPRRLAFSVADLAAQQPDTVEELLGPPKAAAYDADGAPTKAAQGFAQSKGVSLEDIQIASTPKGEYLMVVKEQKGRPTQELLAELLPSLIKELPFPKSMKWGNSKTTFARPIQWIVACYNDTVIPFSLDGVGDSGNHSFGHRFMAPTTFKVSHFSSYIEDLRDRHVLVDIEERRSAVRDTVNSAAQQAGGTVLEDEALVDTVTNLVEKPHAICGSFDPKFLDLPNEVLITSMREHQKYFAIADDRGALRANFIAVNNTAVKDELLGAEGHQRVLRARLEDAMFFFQDDCKRQLASFVPELSGIVFQTKLGTMLDKAERLVELAGFLADQIDPGLRPDAERAAYLAKADLLSAMVNEFPSLQGVMGQHYALRDKESLAVAAAIQEHYMPIRAGSALPEDPVGAIVGLADRIDTIIGCFGIGQTPTGTTDPFGLRRLALGLIHIIQNKRFALSLTTLAGKAFDLFGETLSESKTSTVENVLRFIAGRYTNDIISKGTAAETVEAVTSVQCDDIVDSTLKIKALTAVSSQESFPLLAGAFKRVMNIIKDHPTDTVQEALFQADEEKTLFQTLSSVTAKVQPLIASHNYQEAMQEILQMKEPVDRFFDGVMVMAEDPDVRQNRLSLLGAVAQLFLQIGDFSKMSTVGK